MNRASPQYRHLRQAVELILSDLAQDNKTAFPDTPASKSGKGQTKTITAKAEPLSIYIVTEKNRG